MNITKTQLNAAVISALLSASVSAAVSGGPAMQLAYFDAQPGQVSQGGYPSAPISRSESQAKQTTNGCVRVAQMPKPLSVYQARFCEVPASNIEQGTAFQLTNRYL